VNKNKRNIPVEKEERKEFKLSVLDKKEELLKKIIALGINFLNNIEYLSSNLELEYIGKSTIDELYKEMIIYYTKNNSFDRKAFENGLDKDKSDLLNIILFIFENEYSKHDQNEAFIDIQALVKSYKKEFLNEKLKKLEVSLKLAERKGDQEEIEKITKEFVSVTHKLSSIS